MKKSIIHILSLLALTLSLTSCEELKDWLGLDEDETNSEWTVEGSFNNTDPLVMEATHKDGNVFKFFGTKNSVGVTQQITQVLAYNAKTQETTEVSYENNRIKQIIAPNGVIMNFDWQSNTKIALTLIEPNTNEQLNTVVDVNNPPMGAPAYTDNTDRGITPRQGDLELTLEPQQAATGAGVESRASKYTGTVTVTRCGAPADGYDVFLNIWEPMVYGSLNHLPSGRIYAEGVGNGVYEYEVPQEYKYKIDNVEKYCDAIADAIGQICDANSQLGWDAASKVQVCTYISAAIGSAGVSAPVAAAFLTACSAASFALEGICWGASLGTPTPASLPNVYNKLCELLKEKHISMASNYVIFESCVNAMPKRITGKALKYTFGSTPLDIPLDMGGTTEISSFKLDPAAPSAGTAYYATAAILCTQKDSKVTVSVVGTDGYTNSKTETVDETKTLYTMTLRVPGAASAVRDVCTIEVVSPTGETFRKTASLVFQ